MYSCSCTFCSIIELIFRGYLAAVIGSGIIRILHTATTTLWLLTRDYSSGTEVQSNYHLIKSANLVDFQEV